MILVVQEIHFRQTVSEMLIQSLVLVIGFETVASAPKFIADPCFVPSTTGRTLPASVATNRTSLAVRKLNLHNVQQAAFEPVLTAGELQAL